MIKLNLPTRLAPPAIENCNPSQLAQMPASVIPAFKLPSAIATIAQAPQNEAIITVYDSHGRAKDITLNEQQLAFKNLVLQGKSCILIGAAGTGKTTCTQAALQAIINAGLVPVITGSHKHIKPGLPGILPCAYTRRATNNIKRAMPSDLAINTMTIHKAVEYGPQYYAVTDESTGKIRNTMRFEPARHIMHQLDRTISVVVIDESSMVSVDLFHELESATSKQTIFIFIGDIQQLPPTFGHAILGYKLTELPVIELTEVYRQALDSPIIKLAHRILSGKILGHAEIATDWQYPGQLQINCWPHKISAENALMSTAKSICNAYDAGKYDPAEDVILCPYVKGMNNRHGINLSTTGLNAYIANHIARKNNRLTFEIIAGFLKYYYSIGDSVLYEKEDCVIVDILENPQYVGKSYQAASYTLDYWGHDNVALGQAMTNTDIDIDKLIEMTTDNTNSERAIQASHRIIVEYTDSGEKRTISSLSEMMLLDHSYAMSVHKSQGSEWRKVYLMLHHSHNNMIKRELLYTAVTRAREQLVIICEKDTFIGGIMKQSIKGETLAEKAEYFKGKIAITNSAIDSE
jgi:ATP-dependent exoDNAse (exonuclease V) alpha subunit